MKPLHLADLLDDLTMRRQHHLSASDGAEATESALDGASLDVNHSQTRDPSTGPIVMLPAIIASPPASPGPSSPARPLTRGMKATIVRQYGADHPDATLLLGLSLSRPPSPSATHYQPSPVRHGLKRNRSVEDIVDDQSPVPKDKLADELDVIEAETGSPPTKSGKNDKVIISTGSRAEESSQESTSSSSVGNNVGRMSVTESRAGKRLRTSVVMHPPPVGSTAAIAGSTSTATTTISRSRRSTIRRQTGSSNLQQQSQQSSVVDED